MTPDYALSVCGQYWLRVKEAFVSGPIEDGATIEARESLTLLSFSRRLRDVLAARASSRIEGELTAGEAFQASFGPDFVFRLDPSPAGWTLSIRETGRDDDLSRLTPPFHGPPNPRDIEGWHFRNSDNTGPNETGEKNVNAPGIVREFIFSREVGRSIDGPRATRQPTAEEIEEGIADYRRLRTWPP